MQHWVVCSLGSCHVRTDGNSECCSTSSEDMDAVANMGDRRLLNNWYASYCDDCRQFI
jgi:hypothetical protein